MTNKQLDLEKKVVENFVKKEKRERYIGFLSSEKNRRKFISDLSHFSIFKHELFEKAEGSESAFVFAQLSKTNIDPSKCYVISEDAEIDARYLETKAALNRVIASDMNTILVFGNAYLIYLELEGFANRYVGKIVQ